MSKHRTTLVEIGEDLEAVKIIRADRFARKKAKRPPPVEPDRADYLAKKGFIFGGFRKEYRAAKGMS